MEDDYDEGFFSVDLLLMEAGLVASSVVRSETWAHKLVREEGKDLNDDQRKKLVYQLLGLKKDGRLPWGIQSKLAREIGCHRSTICKIFKKAENQEARGDAIDVSNQKKGHSGRKPYYENSEEWLQSAPLHKRSTYRAYAAAIGCSHMHVFRLLKRRMLRAHTSPNHPNVSDKNKIQRMKWVLSHIEPATTDRKPTFVDMKHTVHIDEKWFYLNPASRRFYLLPKEIDPYRTTKSKNYSIKVMFMGVTSRPLYNEEGEMVHDGKFGIFPFVVQERAKKSSKNRRAGTLETKVITKVNQQVTRDMIVNKVIPAIKAKWPACMSKEILIQQDNAPPHLKDNDPEFRAAAMSNGFNMHFINQPPQSPDFNVLDLGIFRALQSLQYQSFPTNVDDLVVKVQQAYDEFDPNLIRYTWITLQLVMIEALKVKGGNNYKLPHIGKAKLERLNMLPERIEVEQHIVDEAVAYLNEVCGGCEDEEYADMDIDERDGPDEEYINAYINAEEQYDEQFQAYLESIQQESYDDVESDIDEQDTSNMCQD